MDIPAKPLITGVAALLLAGAFMPVCAETGPINGPAFDSEAKQVAADYLRDNYCQCADSYYRAIKVGHAIVIDQFKATKNLVVQPEPVSEADRSAGIEWKGVVVLFEFSAMRHYRRSRWGDWEEPPLIRTISEVLTRKNGRWAVGKRSDWIPGAGFVDRPAHENTMLLDCTQIAFLSDAEDNLLARIPEARDAAMSASRPSSANPHFVTSR